MPQIEGVSACVFDAYGTLFDIAAAAVRHQAVLGAKFQPLVDVWRAKQLQYSWLRNGMGRHVDFWQVTQDSLDYALEQLGLADAGLRARLLDDFFTLAAYPEVPDVLRRLKAAGIRCAILSNGSPAMLEAAVNNAGIADVIDAVVSVEEVGAFKPDPRVYARAETRLGLAKSAMTFQSSNGWDVAAAAEFGWRVVWINRAGLPRERLGGAPVAEVRTLDALLPLVGAA
jgi:2-haloacid dehalogenase